MKNKMNKIKLSFKAKNVKLKHILPECFIA